MINPQAEGAGKKQTEKKPGEERKTKPRTKSEPWGRTDANLETPGKNTREGSNCPEFDVTLSLWGENYTKTKKPGLKQKKKRKDKSRNSVTIHQGGTRGRGRSIRSGRTNEKNSFKGPKVGMRWNRSHRDLRQLDRCGHLKEDKAAERKRKEQPREKITQQIVNRRKKGENQRERLGAKGREREALGD